LIFLLLIFYSSRILSLTIFVRLQLENYNFDIFIIGFQILINRPDTLKYHMIAE